MTGPRPGLEGRTGRPAGLVEVEIPARETILVLEGAVHLAIDRGEPVDLRVGDMLSVAAGSLVGWDPSPDCVVFWVYSYPHRRPRTCSIACLPQDGRPWFDEGPTRPLR